MKTVLQWMKEDVEKSHLEHLKQPYVEKNGSIVEKFGPALNSSLEKVFGVSDRTGNDSGAAKKQRMCSLPAPQPKAIPGRASVVASLDNVAHNASTTSTAPSHNVAAATAPQQQETVSHNAAAATVVQQETMDYQQPKTHDRIAHGAATTAVPPYHNVAAATVPQQETTAAATVPQQETTANQQAATHDRFAHGAATAGAVSSTHNVAATTFSQQETTANKQPTTQPVGHAMEEEDGAWAGVENQSAATTSRPSARCNSDQDTLNNVPDSGGTEKMDTAPSKEALTVSNNQGRLSSVQAVLGKHGATLPCRSRPKRAAHPHPPPPQAAATATATLSEHQPAASASSSLPLGPRLNSGASADSIAEVQARAVHEERARRCILAESETHARARADAEIQARQQQETERSRRKEEERQRLDDERLQHRRRVELQEAEQRCRQEEIARQQQLSQQRQLQRQQQLHWQAQRVEEAQRQHRQEANRQRKQQQQQQQQPIASDAAHRPPHTVAETLRSTIFVHLIKGGITTRYKLPCRLDDPTQCTLVELRKILAQNLSSLVDADEYHFLLPSNDCRCDLLEKEDEEWGKVSDFAFAWENNVDNRVVIRLGFGAVPVFKYLIDFHGDVEENGSELLMQCDPEAATYAEVLNCVQECAKAKCFGPAQVSATFLVPGLPESPYQKNILVGIPEEPAK